MDQGGGWLEAVAGDEGPVRACNVGSDAFTGFEPGLQLVSIVTPRKRVTQSVLPRSGKGRIFDEPTNSSNGETLAW